MNEMYRKCRAVKSTFASLSYNAKTQIGVFYFNSDSADLIYQVLNESEFIFDIITNDELAKIKMSSAEEK